ncbi:MAG: homoserine kinase [Terriglobales bacterium]
MHMRMDAGTIEGLEIAVPASIANLGPGFDTLAVAVRLYTRVRIRRVRADGLRDLHFDFLDQRLEGANYIERAFRFLARQQDADFPSLDLEVSTDIPMKSGLGSSAAATVAGLRLFEAVMGPLPVQGLLNAACALEGHPDNAAAALFGGLTGSCQLADRSTMAVSFRWPEQLQFVVLTPIASLKKGTSEARGILPPKIAREDAIFNMQRLVLLLQAVHSGKFHLLREALRDRLHQPYRQMIVPGLQQALHLDHPDLLGVCLSGAGPSIVAFAERNTDEIERVLAKSYEPLGIPFRIRTLRVHQGEADTSGLPQPQLVTIDNAPVQ